MSYIEIFFISVSLAMDAFAVAICKGISCKKVDKKKCLLVGVMFGFFQAVMPILGFYVGAGLRKLVFAIDHYIVFAFLVVIGVNMMYDAFCGKEKDLNGEISFFSLIVPAIATSIDAFSIGIMFAFMKVNLLISSFIIGIVAFIFSSLGVYIGRAFGKKYEKKAKFMGGVVLVFIGIKTLIKHFI